MPKDGYEREVVNGELIVSPAGFPHGIIITRITARLGTYVHDHGLGELLDSSTGCRMKSGDLFSPDVSFSPKAELRAQRKTGKAFFQGAPDLVVEVLSPGDKASITKEKIAQYFENGARLAWIVQPKTRTVQIYRNGKSADRVLTIKDKLNGEEVVPGFSLPVADIFPD
ncbi:MAG TPA: Uma2 family endonuclease [Phycisphaerae bacterium]|nr:Uma2 family endonuclease [Phycisphaerae bacterium]